MIGKGAPYDVKAMIAKLATELQEMKNSARDKNFSYDETVETKEKLLQELRLFLAEHAKGEQKNKK